ncbi:MAG TPA: response regulator [Fibrobacteria bacterium]|nr:response regulator [Fibrobacteria bacterium]
MRTLVVDDDFTSRRILMRIMQSFGTCDAACNGKEGWQAFCQAHDERDPYEVILLDILMPEMDGHELLGRIRGFEEERPLRADQIARIAMATVLHDKDSVLRSFRGQCDGFITKPYSAEVLVKDLRACGVLPEA